jgi:hypothetical protein
VFTRTILPFLAVAAAGRAQIRSIGAKIAGTDAMKFRAPAHPFAQMGCVAGLDGMILPVDVTDSSDLMMDQGL